jgi:transposase
MARPVKVITASAEVRAELHRRAKAPTSAHRDRFRANIILLRLEGLKIESVAKQLKTSMPTVSTWSGRFEAHGLDGLNDKAGRGRKPSIPRKKIERVVAEEPQALERAQHGSPRRSIAQHRAAYLVEERLEAARREDVQAVERSEIRGKVLGRDRALSRSAGQGAGVILRREEPGSGAHSTRPAACAQTPPAR